MLDKNVIQIIKSRKSIYPSQFSGKILENSIISELIDISNYAPSHKMTQPWVYRVFTPKTKDKLLNHILNINSENFRKHQVDKMKEKFQLTSHVICICMRRDKDKSVPEWEEVAATSMAVQNLWIAMVNSRVGGYWSTPKYSKDLSSFLNLDEGERCLGLFYLGYVENEISKNLIRKDISKDTKWQ